MFSILFFLYQVFKPYGLEKIGQMIALASLWGLVVHAAVPGGQVLLRAREARKSEKTAHVCEPGRRGRGCWRPWPSCRCRTACMATLEIQPREADPVYVDVAEGGRLAEV